MAKRALEVLYVLALFVCSSLVSGWLDYQLEYRYGVTDPVWLIVWYIVGTGTIGAMIGFSGSQLWDWSQKKRD